MNHNFLKINTMQIINGGLSKIFHNRLLIFGEIWKKMEIFGAGRKVINKKTTRRSLYFPQGNVD